MAQTTGIEWASATWNPWYGCQKVSPGCKNCYMFRDMKRYGRDPSVVVQAKSGTFTSPLKWRKSLKSGSRIFTCSWSDWFIDHADSFRPAAWEIVKQTPQFNYLILTKRPERIPECLPPDWGNGYPNVWLGVSAENQAMADLRLPFLQHIPAAIRFVSAEPLLDSITFKSLEGIHWVITGGESDMKEPRFCDFRWVRSIRDQCQVAGVAFFHKQHGGTQKVDGAWGGREIDGRTYDEFPKGT